MRLSHALLLVSTGIAATATAAGSSSPTSAPPAPEAGAVAPVPPPAVDVDEAEEEAEELKRLRIPAPPADRRRYRAWRRALPAATRRKLERYCWRNGGEHRAACDGIGPYAIPVPPSRIREPERGPDGQLLGLTHDQWRASLTPPQARYYEEYCDGREDTGFSQLCGGTPLVLAFDDQRVAYTQGGRFALAPGDTVATDWPTAATPWLALDLDGDGAITSGAELFGGTTLLPSGQRARNGFEALAALDASGDGVIDAADPAFARLLVWADRDGDRRSTPAELAPASTLVTALSLAAERVPHCDARGNCEGERAPLVWRDATGARHTGSVVDVYLRFR